MGTKVWSKWIKDGTAEVKNAIDSIGIWQCVDQYYEINGGSDVLVIISRDVDADPVGTTGSVGIRTFSKTSASNYRVPELIEGGSFTLSSLAEGEQITVTNYFEPKGKICITITNYVSPLLVEVVQ